MKKFIALTLALCFLLAACSSPPTGAEQTSDSSVDAAEETMETDVQSNNENAPEEEPEDASAQSSDALTFGIPSQNFIDIMSDALSEVGLYNAFEQEVEPTTMDDGSIAFSYPITDGSTIVLYEDSATEELMHVFVSANTSAMDKDDHYLVGAYLGLITGCFATSAEDVDAIDAALQIGNGLSTDAFNLYDNSFASFTYIVTDGTATLSILPAM